MIEYGRCLRYATRARQDGARSSSHSPLWICRDHSLGPLFVLSWCFLSASLVSCEVICIASQGREDVIKMLISWSHLDVKYPVKVSSRWPSPRFFEMLSGEYSADSCLKQEEIDYLVICVSCGLHPDKE
jgi:hypothetical protein